MANQFPGRPCIRDLSMGSFDSDVAWGGNKLSSLATHNVFGMQWARLNNGLVYLSESFRKMHSGCGRGSAVSTLHSTMRSSVV